MREYVVEKAFRDEVVRQGGLALKFTSQTMNGVPDRLVLLPNGKAGFVELKAPGKMMRPLQVKRKMQLEELGYPVFCVDRFEQIRTVIEAIRNYIPGSSTEGIGAKIPVLEKVMAVVEERGDIGFMEFDEFAARYGDPFPEFHRLTEGEIEAAVENWWWQAGGREQEIKKWR